MSLAAVVLVACEDPGPTDTQAQLTLNGIPVLCAPVFEEDVCLARAESGVISLNPGHPAIRSIEVTCNAERCDEDEGAGQVRIFFTDGTHVFIEIGFGRTT
jgi:hypothetical protein